MWHLAVLYRGKSSRCTLHTTQLTATWYSKSRSKPRLSISKAFFWWKQDVASERTREERLWYDEGEAIRSVKKGCVAQISCSCGFWGWHLPWTTQDSNPNSWKPCDNVRTFLLYLWHDLTSLTKGRRNIVPRWVSLGRLSQNLLFASKTLNMLCSQNLS